ncbi:MAG: SPOR domain-containing protein [Candidatus Eremiobacterota bacterium]
MLIWLRRLQAGLVIGLTLVCLSALAAQEPASPGSEEMAILIVGDGSNAEMQRQEEALKASLIQEIRTRIKRWGEKRLPVYSYHFDKTRERTHCEQRLNILKEDLLFVGIVRLEKKVPRKVLYRIDRLVNPNRSAVEVVSRAEEMLGVNVAVSPTATDSPSPSPSEQAGSWKIQLGSFSQLKNAEELVAQLREKGHVASIVREEEGGATMFKVFIGPFANRQEVLTAIDALKAQGFDKAFPVEVDGAGTPGDTQS